MTAELVCIYVCDEHGDLTTCEFGDGRRLCPECGSPVRAEDRRVPAGGEVDV